MNLVFRILFVALVVFGAPLASAGELAVIVNAELDVTTLTKEQVAAYFLKNQASWPSGSSVDPVFYAEDNPLRIAFDKAVLSMTPGEEDRHWIEKGYAGGIKPPAKVPEEKMALALVALKKGALAYVSAASATDPKVKIVLKVSY